MKEKVKATIYIIGMLFGLLIMVSGLVSMSYIHAKQKHDTHWMEEAVKHGHAEWYQDENGDTKWRWKPVAE